jgi:1,4-dihydroxy-2-naphthoyl-CoA hydrolase
MPFAALTGIEIAEVAAQRVVGTLAWAPERCTSASMLHGGAIFTLADSVGALCAVLNLPPGATTSTISSSINFMRGVREGAARAVAVPLHVGKTTIVVRIEVWDGSDRLVAQVTATQAVIAPRA